MARDPPQSQNGFFRLTPAQNILAGFTRTARRYASVTIGEIVAGVETISMRAYENLKNLAEFGRPVSRERRTRMLVRQQARYRTEQAKEAAQYARRTRGMRAAVPGITRADLRLMDQKRRGLPVDNAKLGQLFDRYPREQVLEALGSPERIQRYV